MCDRMGAQGATVALTRRITIIANTARVVQTNGTLVHHTSHGDWNYTLCAHPDTPHPR